MNILVTICVRGGSKGVPKKNIRPLGNRPLIAYTISQAQQWGRARTIVVSTDSAEIAAVARKYGAEVPFMRPASLATDATGKLPVIRHALRECEVIYGEIFDTVVDLDATAPLRTVADLENCRTLFERERPNSLFSVVEAHKNPYFNMVELNEFGKPVLCKKSGATVQRRQDAPPVFNLNASIYFFNRGFLLEGAHSSVVTENSRIYVMPDASGFDIDREIDFKLLEFLVQEGEASL
jgi:CMP-N,N'-diacetyllegionaminic acid synthase